MRVWSTLVCLVLVLVSASARAQDEEYKPSEWEVQYLNDKIKEALASNPLEGLVAPGQPELPNPTKLPDRFCTEEEKKDFEAGVVEARHAQINRAFGVIGKYASDVRERRRFALDRLEYEKGLIGAKPYKLQRDLLAALQKRIDKAKAEEAVYEKIYTTVSDALRASIKTRDDVEKVKVEACTAPLLREISYPVLPEPICTEEERQAAIDLLEPVVDTAVAGTNDLNKWWADLTVRRDDSTGGELKGRLAKDAEEARLSAVAAQKVSDELTATLADVRSRPLACMDPCLVGSWKGKELLVTIDKAGAQTVIYYDAHPEGVPGVKWSGVGQNVITAAKGIAKVKEAKPGTVFYWIEQSPVPLGNLVGYGGLGALDGDNTYTCTETTLSYQGSTRADRQPNFAVELTRTN